jgi:hypothetical protein
MSFNIKRGLKKIGSMIELESPKEFMKDYRKLQKEGGNLYWNITLDDPEAEKKTFKGVKSFKGWGKTMKAMKEDLFKKKKEKGERGFWK